MLIVPAWVTDRVLANSYARQIGLYRDEAFTYRQQFRYDIAARHEGQRSDTEAEHRKHCTSS